jgi:SnoaL-like domain
VDSALRELRDESEIRRLVVGMSLAMDARDVNLFRAAWAEEIDLELPRLAGDAVPMSGRQRADDYAAGVIALLSEFAATQHVSANHFITVTGDRGTCACYTLAQHRLLRDDGDAWFTAGARYDLVAQRFADLGWRFVAFRLTALWSTGDASVWKEATRRLRARRSG